MSTKMANTVPYTYLIGWSKLNKWYYGVRFAKGCNPSELWITYKTSSKHVKKFYEEHGEPDVVQIRKTFKDSTSARVWENIVLRRLNVIHLDHFINKSNNIAISSDVCGHGKGGKKGRVLSKDHLAAIKKANTGKSPWNKGKTGYKIKRTTEPWNKNKKTNIKPWNYGLTKDEDVRIEQYGKSISKTLNETPVVWTDERRKNHSKALTERTSYKWNKEKIKNSNVIKLNNNPLTCPHCGKIGQHANMKRWHFTNCKYREE